MIQYVDPSLLLFATFPLHPLSPKRLNSTHQSPRCCSGSDPGGSLSISELPSNADSHGLQWRQLLAAEPGCRFEALLLPPHGGNAHADLAPLPPHALVLCWRDDPGSGCSERLVARVLQFGSAAALTASVAADIPVPLPHAACALHGASWLQQPERQEGLGQLTVTFSSLVTPRTQLVLDLPSRRSAAFCIGGGAPGFDPAGFTQRTACAAAPDGARVPLTVAWSAPRRAALRAAFGGAAPLVLFAYGSAGLPERDAAFGAARAALMRLGFAVAVAHVRGGGWRGRGWAEAGRGAARKGAVATGDLAACADALVEGGWCERRELALAGSSAGGWLVAAALAARPGLAAAAVLTVPCTDPLGALVVHGQNTLEWGAAEGGDGGGDAEAAAVAELARWSPYQHLAALARGSSSSSSGSSSIGSSEAGHQGGDLAGPPHLLVRTALYDRAVGFWDGAKSVARLRHLYAEAAAETAAAAAAAAAPTEPDAGGEQAEGVNQPRQPLVLLRAVPGGHSSYEGDAGETALAAAFLVKALVPGWSDEALVDFDA